jgi:hypothetical protein
MNKLIKTTAFVCFVVAVSLISTSVVFGQSWGSQQSVIYGLDANGNVVPIEVENGALKSTAEITGDVNLDQSSLAVVDNDGDTWGVTTDGEGTVRLTSESVNIATDTELKNLQDIVSKLQDIQTDTGIVIQQYNGSTVPVDIGQTIKNDTDVVITENNAGLATESSLTSEQPRRVTNFDTTVVIRGETSGNDEVTALVSPSGEQVVLARQDGTWVVQREWTLEAESDSVGATQVGSWSVDVNNQDTDISIVNETVGLAKTTDITSLENTIQDTLPREVVVDTDLPVNVTNSSLLVDQSDTDRRVTNVVTVSQDGTVDVNQVNQDTDVSIVSSIPLDRAWDLSGVSDSVAVSNLSEISNDTDVDIVSSVPLDRNWNLSGQSDTVNVDNLDEIETTNDTDVVIHASNSDTLTAIDNALRVTESRPQRSIFDEATGETATVKKGGLSVREHEMAEDTVVYNELSGGETVAVDLTGAEEWELKTSGADVHYSTSNNNPDTFTGMPVFDQTGSTEVGVGDSNLYIFATGQTKTWVRIRR